MKLGHWPKFQQLHRYSLSTPDGRNWAYFRSTGSGFWDTGRFSKLPYLGMKLGHRPKFQKLHIFPLSIPSGGKIELIFALRTSVSKIWADFQIWKLWAWKLAIRQSARSCTHTLFVPQGLEIELIFALLAAFSVIRANFSKLPYLGMKFGHEPKFQKLYIYYLYYPRVPNFSPCWPFPRYWQLCIFPLVTMLNFNLFLIFTDRQTDDRRPRHGSIDMSMQRDLRAARLQYGFVAGRHRASNQRRLPDSYRIFAYHCLWPFSTAMLRAPGLCGEKKADQVWVAEREHGKIAGSHWLGRSIF